MKVLILPDAHAPERLIESFQLLQVFRIIAVPAPARTILRTRGPTGQRQQKYEEGVTEDATKRP